MISEDEVITNHGDTKWLPYKTGRCSYQQHSWVGPGWLATEKPVLAGNITIFRQTSTHLQMATTFGLELVVQLRPIFQLYITVGSQFQGQTRGELCPHHPLGDHSPHPCCGQQ